MADVTLPAELIGAVMGQALADALPYVIIIPFAVDTSIILRTEHVEHVFLMRGRDANCGVLTYRYWQTFDNPDFTGVQYGGSHCGGAVNLVEIALLRTMNG